MTGNEWGLSDEELRNGAARRRVLVVDDEEGVRHLLRRLLNKDGYHGCSPARWWGLKGAGACSGAFRPTHSCSFAGGAPAVTVTDDECRGAAGEGARPEW